MKLIVIIRYNPFFQNSASANRSLTLIEGLSTLGVEIQLLIKGGYSNITEYKRLGRKGSFRNVNYQYLSLTFNHNIWLRRINTYFLDTGMKYWISFKINKIIKKNSEAILWTESDLNSFRLVSKLKKSNPNIRTFLELSEFMDIHNFNKGNALQRNAADKRQSFFEKEALYAYDGLALMTKTLIKHYESFPKSGPRLLHLPMTVDFERFNNQTSPLDGFKVPYIAFVGVMNDAKDGVNILIEAFIKIHKQYPEYRLYLIGGWNYDTPFHQKMIEENGMKDRIFWKGEFSRDQIPSIIKNSSLLVLPRPNSKQAEGGFPTKLGEYLASGQPVCATTVGEIPDYLVDEVNAYLAEPGSVASFADAMQRALCDKEKAAKVGKNGRTIAEQCFNMDIQSKILYDFLKKI